MEFYRMCCGQSAGRGKRMFSHFKLVGKKIFEDKLALKGRKVLVGREKKMSAPLNRSV